MGRKTQIILAGLSLAVLIGTSACAPHSNSNQDIVDLASEIGSTENIFGGDVVADADLEVGSTVGIYNLMFGQVFCTGTLVGKNLILTAAHCTTGDPAMLAIYFDNKLNVPADEARARKILLPVIAGQTHPQWAKNTFASDKNWGDLALLRFEGALPPGYKSVRILANRDLLQKGQMLNLVGYGYTQGNFSTRADALNKAYVPVYNPEFSDSE